MTEFYKNLKQAFPSIKCHKTAPDADRRFLHPATEVLMTWQHVTPTRVTPRRAIFGLN